MATDLPASTDRPASTAGESSGAPPGYHSESALLDAIQAAVGREDDRISHRIIGHSVQGRPMHAVHVAAVGLRPDPSRPQAMIQGGMHGVEVIGTELALHLLERLTASTPDPDCAALLERCDVTVVPCANPDGREASLAGVMSPRRYAPGSRRNANGVDLNRNWPAPAGVSPHWLPVSGTGWRRLPWYRGVAPLSEPENRALLGLLEDRTPLAMLDLHSSGQILVYPWTSRPEPPADEAGFWLMIDALTTHQKRWVYRAKHGYDWYPIVGSMDDFVYDRFGTMMLTVEIGRPGDSWRTNPRLANRSFWFANPTDVAPHLDNDGDGCLAALLAGVEYRLGHPALTAGAAATVQR